MKTILIFLGMVVCLFIVFGLWYPIQLITREWKWWGWALYVVGEIALIVLFVLWLALQQTEPHHSNDH